MHPENIKAELRKRGLTITELANRLVVSQGMVSRVIRSQARSHRIEVAIARYLDLTPADLWPAHYPAKARKSAK